MFPEATVYLDRLRARLELGDSVESDIVRELGTHVEDRIARLMLDGIAESEARRVAISGLGRPQTFAHLMRQAHVITAWREALFGAAPLLLVAALVGARLWQQPAIVIASFVLVVAITLYGLSQGRPVWFYSWAGVALTLPLIAGYIAFAVLRSAVPQLAAGQAGPWELLGVAGASLYFPVGFLVVAGAVGVAIRRDWLDASVLVSPLPGIFVWLIAVHRSGGLRYPSGALADTSIPLGILYLCMALATVAVLRSRSRTTKVAMILASALILISISTPVDSQAAIVTFAVRAVLLAVFLLSPALVAQRSWQH